MTSVKWPGFIESPATAIIGPKCFKSLLENLDYEDSECIKFAISKALGLGIVAGGLIVKVPQIGIILRSRSARGLSMSAFLLELVSCAISTVYNVRNGYAFSTYGENLFLTIQNAIIALQIIHYRPTLTKRDSNAPRVYGAAAAMLISSVALYLSPLGTLTLLQGLTIPISAIAKLPQILANEKHKSTGNLSRFVVVANILGCIARVFTTITEVNDPLVLWGFVLSSVLNIVIGLQMYAYWGRSGPGGSFTSDSKYRLPTEKVKLDVSGSEGIELQQAPNRNAARLDTASLPRDGSPASGRRTPPAYSPSPSGGRRWTRKVD